MSINAMGSYVIPKNDYVPVREEVVQRLINFYLNNFGGDYFCGCWIVGRRLGLCKCLNGEDRLFDLFRPSTREDEVFVSNAELIEFSKVWHNAGYYISTLRDRGERFIAFTKEPYTNYGYKLITDISEYL